MNDAQPAAIASSRCRSPNTGSRGDPYSRLGRRTLRAVLAIAAACVLATDLDAQGSDDQLGAIPPRNLQTIALDLTSGVRTLRVPFMESFSLTVPLLEAPKHVRLTLVDETRHRSGFPATYSIQVGRQHTGAKTVSFYIAPLPAKALVTATLTYWWSEPSGAQCGAWLDRLPLAELGPAKTPSDDGNANTPQDTTVSAECGKYTFRLHAPARFTSHFDLDLGILRSANAGYTGVIVAVHLHPVPLNDNTPSQLRGLGHRVSLFGGLAITEIASQHPVTKPFSAGIPVTGIGVKVGPTRIIGGLMFFDQEDANPVVEKERAKVDYTFGLSLDFAVHELLGVLARAVGL